METKTMIIDETTGLPQLPEGLFWRVGEVPTFSRGYYIESVPKGERTDNGEIWVELCKMGEKIEKVSEMTRIKGTWKTFWFPTWEPVKVEKVVEAVVPLHRLPMAEYKVIFRYEKDRDGTETPQDLLVEGWRYSVSQPYDFKRDFFRLYPSTPESVLSVAMKVYDLWQEGLEEKKAAKAEQDARDRISGVYPPKRLPLA